MSAIKSEITRKKWIMYENVFKTLPIAIMLLTPLGAHAGNGGNAGNGTSDGKPGCDGGTNPSPDGKFYIPGTKQECNPSDDDRKKLK